MSHKVYYDYDTVVKAHEAAHQNKWISRIGYDNEKKSFWIEYIGKQWFSRLNAI